MTDFPLILHLSTRCRLLPDDACFSPGGQAITVDSTSPPSTERLTTAVEGVGYRVTSEAGNGQASLKAMEGAAWQSGLISSFSAPAQPRLPPRLRRRSWGKQR